MIALPMPPSLNAIWRYGKGRAFKSKRYVAWLRAADAEFLLHRKEWLPVKGHFHAHILLNSTKRRSNQDCDNRCKVVLDFLQRVGIIENDSLCDGVAIGWGVAPEGVRIYLAPSPIPEFVELMTAPGRPVGPQRRNL
jgi:Holliday junction resolvase RusA-like endonuclease